MTREEFIVTNPLNIGGRSTDIAQIAYTISTALRLAFAPNRVPVEYVKAVDNLTKLLEVAEAEIERVTDLLREDGN